MLDFGVLVDSLDEGSHVVGVHVGVNSVPEVRDPALPAKLFGHLLDELVDGLGRGVEGARVEVSLQRDVIADSLPADPRVDRPVEPDDLVADVAKRLQREVAALGENGLQR